MWFNTIVAIGVTIIFIVLLILFLIPTSKKGSKKRERPPEQLPKETDWQAVAHKLEGHIYALRNQIADLEKKGHSSERELSEIKTKNKQLEEKLTLEEGWHKKEQEEIDKRTKEIGHLKEELKKAEEGLEREHTQRLRYERELAELKQSFEITDGHRKKIEIEMQKLKATLENMTKEMLEYKRENIQLKKKQEDTSFIAKSEYDKLERILREKEKELERIKREM